MRKGEQKDEEAMAADQEEVHRDRDQDCADMGVSTLCLACGVPGLESSQDVGSARDAFEPRGSEEPVQETDGSSVNDPERKKEVVILEEWIRPAGSSWTQGQGVQQGEHWPECRQEWQQGKQQGGQKQQGQDLRQNWGKNSSKGCGDKSNEGSNRVCVRMARLTCVTP